MTGVIPLPAANSRKSPSSERGLNVPAGGTRGAVGLGRAPAGADGGPPLPRGPPGVDRGEGPPGRRAPLHARVLRAKLDDQHRRGAAIALDPPESVVPLVRPAHIWHGQ